MKAFTWQFNNSNTDFRKLLDVFVNSWKRNAKIPLEVSRPPLTPDFGDREESYYINHAKLRDWIGSVDQDTILIDCDMLLLDDISDAFDRVEHIGITTRPGEFPVNGGVIYVKNTQKARAFLKKWYEVDGRMLDNEDFHTAYFKKVGGMNQSSLKWMLDNGYRDMVTGLPCSIYNLCDGQWDEWRQAKNIHIKGYLREYILGYSIPPGFKTPAYDEISGIWQSYNPNEK